MDTFLWWSGVFFWCAAIIIILVAVFVGRNEPDEDGNETEGRGGSTGAKHEAGHIIRHPRFSDGEHREVDTKPPSR